MHSGPRAGAVPNPPRRGWLSRQFTKKNLFRFAILLGIFGYIPGFWSAFIPFLFTYSLIKQRTIAQGLFDFSRLLRRLFQSFSETIGEIFGNVLASHPLTIAKWSGIFLFWFLSSVPLIGIIGVYGLARLSSDDWQNTWEKTANKIYLFFVAMIDNISQRATFNRQLGILIGFSCFVALNIFLGGWTFLFSLSFFFFQITAFLIGLRAVLRDIFSGLINFPKTYLENYGKLHYLRAGKHLAEDLFSGHLQGALGPAKGFVHNYGVGTGLLSYLFAPSGKFIIGNYLEAASQAFAASVAWIFTYQIEMVGNFSGQIGPTPFHLIFFMVSGALMGATLEKAIDKLIDSLASDVDYVKNMRAGEMRASIQPFQAFLGHYAAKVKWHAAFVATATPLILFSPGGAAFLVFAEGSLATASLLVAGSLAAALGGVYLGGTALYNLPRLFRRRQRVPAGQNVPPAPRLAGVPGGLTPELRAPILPAFNAQQGRVVPVLPQQAPVPAPQAGVGRVQPD